MNKTQISLLAGLAVILITIIIGGTFWYNLFRQSDSGSICGDGICDQQEEESFDCSEDCLLDGEEFEWPDEFEVVTEKDIQFAKVDGISLELNLHMPERYIGYAPVVIAIHGGAWTGGDKADYGLIAEEIASHGFVVASINYRFSSDEIFPAQIHDVKAAVRWIRANAEERGFDTDNIGVIGSSSGAHLAALLGTSGEVRSLEGNVGNNLDYSSQVQAVVDLYGPVNLVDLAEQCGDECASNHDSPNSPESKLIGCQLSTCRSAARVASANTYISSDDPAFFILHGDEDPNIPIAQSKQLAEELEQAGVEVDFIVAEGYGHDRGMFWEYSDQIINFLAENLREWP